jgi:ketosteroid isomerase-like protein
MNNLMLAGWLCAGLVLHAGGAECQSNAALTDQVRAAETAFAKTMADRDHAAFTSFLADEVRFYDKQTPIRGKAAVAAAWKPLFEGAMAPFSWVPETVEVVDSGTLALTSGPVRGRDGKQTGTFNSIWRREADGRWKILFDKGAAPCVR